MAKVNYIKKNIEYTSQNNPNMKFQMAVRSYDQHDRLANDIADNLAFPDYFYINGVIDGIDVVSDFLANIGGNPNGDVPQSQHIILRDPGSRVFEGYDYHMIESLANTCDQVGRADITQYIYDKFNIARRIEIKFSKKANEHDVTINVYAEGLLMEVDILHLNYYTTDYSDEGPKTNYIDKIQDGELEEIWRRVEESIENGGIVDLIIIPTTEKGIYDRRYSYEITFTSYKHTVNEIRYNDVTVAISYIKNNVKTLYKSATLSFTAISFYDASKLIDLKAKALKYDLFDFLYKKRVKNYQPNQRVEAAADTVLINTADNCTLVPAAGLNDIENYGVNCLIISGLGADSIENHGAFATIIAGLGDDTVHNGIKDTAIEGGNGANVIVNKNEYSTISAGNGKSDVLLIDESDTTYANCVILTGGSYSTVKSGDYTLIVSGNSTIRTDANLNDITIS